MQFRDQFVMLSQQQPYPHTPQYVNGFETAVEYGAPKEVAEPIIEENSEPNSVLPLENYELNSVIEDTAYDQ